jgi:hypothetical protein
MKLEKYQNNRVVLIEDIVQAIKEFEKEGKNPHGPNVANPDHSPVMLELRYGGPPFKEEGYPFPIDPSEEFPLNEEDRDPETARNLQGAAIITKHKILYPLTKAYIKQQWHRVYAYDTEEKRVKEVRLLVSQKQDPSYKAAGFKSAHQWTISLQEETTPVFEEILTKEELLSKKNIKGSTIDNSPTL